MDVVVDSEIDDLLGPGHRRRLICLADAAGVLPVVEDGSGLGMVGRPVVAEF